MDKRDIFGIILDKGKTSKELASTIQLEDYVKGFPLSELKKEDKLTYGVNVRLSKDSGSDVLPFSFSFPPFKDKPEEIAKRVGKGLKIPDFLNHFSIEEAVFRADFKVEHKENDEKLVVIKSIKTVKFLSQWCTLNPYKTHVDDIEGMKDRFLTEFFAPNNDTFLHENIKAMEIEGEGKVYVWVRGQDPDVSINTDCSYLTNILAIVYEKSDLLDNFIKNHKTDILEFIMLLKSRKTDDADIKQKKEAVKSAKAAIMSRNMSHNLGSHVMSYLKQHLGSVREMLNNNVLSKLLEEEDTLLALLALKDDRDVSKAEKIIKESIQKRKLQDCNDEGRSNTGKGGCTDDTKEKNDPIDKVALPFLVGLGQFVSYLQERQDFIATIATDYIPYFSTLNFKDFIYDELNNDKRYERHPDRENLRPDNVLLGNIARSEGLGRETSPTRNNNGTMLGDIVLKFRTTFTGNPVEEVRDKKNNLVVNPIKYYIKKDNVVQAFHELSEMRKYEVSLPGGVVGRQAVFSIIENTIRNAAKHGNWREKGELELTIDIISKEDIRIKEDNNCKKYSRKDTLTGEYLEMNNDALNDKHLQLGEVLERFYFNTMDANDIFVITITDNLILSEENLSKLRQAIAENYVNDDGEMLETNKGIKEMRISAAWLRAINDEKMGRPILKDKTENEYSLEDFKYDKEWKSLGKVAPVLYARISNGHLQYLFCLIKPQKVAFVSPDFAEIEYEDFCGKNVFLENGWKLFSPQTFIDCKNKNFDYVVFDNESIKQDKEVNMYKKVRRRSSSQFFKTSQVSNMLRPIKDVVFCKDKDLNRDIIKGLLKDAYNEFGKLLAQRTGEEMILVMDGRAKKNFEDDKTINDEGKAEIRKMITFEEINSENHSSTQKNFEENKTINDKGTAEIREVITSEEHSKAKYRYITHLESKQNFLDLFVNNKDSESFIFSEGITGNNSTDRLLRNETLNKEWFYSHLYVMKQKVGIFDERLFSKAFGLEETDFVIPKIDNFDNVLNGAEKLKKVKEELIKRFPIEEDEINDLKDFNQINEYLEHLAEKFLFDPQKGKDKEFVDSKCHLGATYAAKRLFIFSIIRSCVQPKSFNLYGYAFDRENKEAFSKCVKYATICWDANNKKLDIEPCGEDLSILEGYDFISVHQGILDKLYETFGIKGDEQAKEYLTKRIYTFFMLERNNSHEKKDKKEKRKKISDGYFKIDDIDDKICHYYLPGMTIHSGRSKPSKHDMPQQLPFIPYSAIEHAVMDCKYSLVKLLNTARYE